MLNFSQNEKRDFLKAAFLTLKQYGFISPLETDPYCEITRKFFHEWGGDIKFSNIRNENPALGDAVAIRDFNQFVFSKKDTKQKNIVATMGKRQIAIDRLGVTIEIQLAERGRLQFEASGVIPADAETSEIEDYYSELFHTAWKGYLALVNQPENFTMSGVQQSYTTKPGDTVETMQMTSVISVSEGGKRQFKCKGDKYPIHGVRVFPEILIKAGIDPALIDGEKYVVGLATILMKPTGEPHKVIAIDTKDAGL